MNWASIDSDNGSTPIRHQAIISTNVGQLSIWLLGTNFSEILIFFIQENLPDNIVCDMAAIMPRGMS